MAVSDLCNELGLQPSAFYHWLRQVHENLAGALTTPARVNGPSKREKELAAESEQLKARLAKKDGVIAEIAAEYTQLKKNLGALTGRWVPHDVRDAVVDFVRTW